MTDTFGSVSFSETLNMAPYLQAEEEPQEGGAGGAGAEEEEGYQVRTFTQNEPNYGELSRIPGGLWPIFD